MRSNCICMNIISPRSFLFRFFVPRWTESYVTQVPFVEAIGDLNLKKIGLFSSVLFAALLGACATSPPPAVTPTSTTAAEIMPPPAAPVVQEPTSPTVAAPVAPMTLEEAQKHLNLVGYKTGVPDGKMGPKTRAALRGYQKSKGLKVTGVLDESTIEKLSSQ
jgi:hypothetical protein